MLMMPVPALLVRMKPVMLPPAGIDAFSFAARCGLWLSLLVNVYADVEVLTVAIVFTVAATVKVLEANVGDAERAMAPVMVRAARADLRNTVWILRSVVSGPQSLVQPDLVSAL
jgi:hypothetical protein